MVHPSKTYVSSKFSGIYSVFLTFWTLKLRAFFDDMYVSVKK